MFSCMTRPARLDEMCLIMDELYKYVPDIPVARTFETPASERLTINDYEVFQIPLVETN